MEELLNLLTENFPNIDFKSSNKLVDDDILDSLDIISIISELTDFYDIDIPAEAVVPENFNSLAGMKKMIDECVEN